MSTGVLSRPGLRLYAVRRGPEGANSESQVRRRTCNVLLAGLVLSFLGAAQLHSAQQAKLLLLQEQAEAPGAAEGLLPQQPQDLDHAGQFLGHLALRLSSIGGNNGSSEGAVAAQGPAQQLPSTGTTDATHSSSISNSSSSVKSSSVSSSRKGRIAADLVSGPVSNPGSVKSLREKSESADARADAPEKLGGERQEKGNASVLAPAAREEGVGVSNRSSDQSTGGESPVAGAPAPAASAAARASSLAIADTEGQPGTEGKSAEEGSGAKGRRRERRGKKRRREADSSESAPGPSVAPQRRRGKRGKKGQAEGALNGTAANGIEQKADGEGGIALPRGQKEEQRKKKSSQQEVGSSEGAAEDESQKGRRRRRGSGGGEDSVQSEERPRRKGRGKGRRHQGTEANEGEGSSRSSS